MIKNLCLYLFAVWCVLFAGLAVGTAAENRIVLKPDYEIPTKLAHCFVFTQGETVVLPIRAETESPAIEGQRLKFEITDFWGAPVENGVATLRRSGDTTGFTLRPKVTGNGWYRIAFRPEEAAQPLTIAYAANHEFGVDRGEFVTFTIIPRPIPLAQRAAPIGIDSAAAYYDSDYLEVSAELAYASGASWCRERWSWNRDHLAPGRYDWALQDKAINAFARRGLGVMNVFEDSPNWMRRDGTTHKETRYPDDLQAAYRFGAEIAERYRGKIFGWEIWNEQDIAHFSGGTPDHYAAMAKAISLGMRSAKNPPLVSNGPFARRPNVFNEILWGNELTHYFDAYDFHGYAPFETGAFFRRVDTHLTESLRLGFKDRQKWMSEMGAMFARRADRTDFDDAAHRQVHYVVRAFTEYIARGVDRLGWFLLRPWFGDGKAAGSVQNGLVRIDWTPFPAYTAFAVMTSQLGKADYQGRLSLGELQGYVFDTHFGRERDQVAVVWKETGDAASLDLGAFRGVEAVDIMGRAIDPSKGSIAVGRMPVYLKGVDWSGRLEMVTPGPKDVPEVTFPKDRVFDVVLFSVVDRSRIISREDAMLENWDHIGSKWSPAAYRFAPGETVELTMDVYNFSDREVSAVVRFDDVPGIEVNLAQSTVRIAPMSRAEVPFSVHTKIGTTEFRLKAQAEIAGGSTTPWLSLWQPAKDEHAING